MSKDLYAILGVSRDADDKKLKSAYRKLAKKYHPDANPGDKDAEQKFKDVGEAYAILSDPEKRKLYDAYGYAAFDGSGGMGGGFGGFGGFGGGGGFGGTEGFGDIFDMFFGGGGRGSRRPGPERGSDLRYDLEISFEEAAFGKDVELDIPRTENCPDCHGTGAAMGSSPEDCPDCHGTGQQEIAQNTPFGRIVNRRTCGRCGGTGKIVKNPCKTCHGSGKQRVRRKIKVHIPKGVDQGSRVRVSGGGEAGTRGGENGDLYVYIFVKQHKLFKRQGNDVIVEVPISFVQAALGATVQVPTLDGPVDLKIPAGIQSGKILRIRDKGVPFLRGNGRGDEHVVVKVLTPQKLSTRQKELLKEFAELSGDSVNPEQKSFMDTLKNLFK